MNKLKEYFGTVSQEQIKSNIRRIIASYRNIWDILIELIQNSADAIIDKYTFDKIDMGEISIEVDTVERKIRIKDNGCGIIAEDLSKILVTGASLKRAGSSGKYGFMGFGLTFVAFQSNYIKIESVNNKIYHSATYIDLYKVVFSDSDIPSSEEEKLFLQPIAKDEDTWTQIEIYFPEEIEDGSLNANLKLLFEFCKNKKLIEYILRTRSAVGLIDTIFEEKSNFKFSMNVNGNRYNITNRYMTNKEIVEALYPDDKTIYKIDGDYGAVINISEKMPEFQQRATRNCNLLYTTVDNESIGTQNPMKARLYIEGTSKENLNEYAKLIGIDGKSADEIGGFKIQNGIWLSINGLPTGIQIDKLDHGNYLPFTVVVDIIDSEIKKELDAGRKGITDYKVRLIREKVKEILTDKLFMQYRPYIVQADTRVSSPLYDPRREFEDILSKKEYNEKLKVNSYIPPNEEQEVISIFTEMIANSMLVGYTCKVVSSFRVYDGYYQYNVEKKDTSALYSVENTLGIVNSVFNKLGNVLNKDLVVEFKRDFECIYKDINKNLKDFSQIDLLVCWNVNYDKKDSIRKKYGDQIVEISPQSRYFYGTTNEIITSKRQNPLPVIELQKVLNLVTT